MQTYNFDNINKEYDGNTLLYTCTDNGMPERDIEDPEYDPAQLYFGEYKASIVLSLSVTNTAPHTINVDVFVNKGGSVGYVTKKVQIPPATTCVILGGQQKIILEHEDELHVQPFFVQSSPIWNNNDVKIIASVMNLYDYPFIPPMLSFIPWYGDKGIMADGYGSIVDKWWFSSSVSRTDFMRLDVNSSYASGASNGVIGLIIGGTYNNNVYGDRVSSISYMDDSYIASYSSLSSSRQYTQTSSNAISFYMAGGRSPSEYYTSIIDLGTYDSGSTSSSVGNLSHILRYHASINSNENGIWAGGYTNSIYLTTVQYIAHDSAGNTSLWGNLDSNILYSSGASNKDVGFFAGNSNGIRNIYKKIEFASQSNVNNWGNIQNNDYALSGSSDGIDALFNEGAYSGNSYRMSLDSEAGSVMGYSDITVTNINGYGVSFTGSGEESPPPPVCVYTIELDGDTLYWDLTSDCQSVNRDRDGCYAIYYTFTLTETTVISAESGGTDTYLYLLDGHGKEGAVIDYDDDGGNGEANSGIYISLPAGDYTLESTTYSAGNTSSIWTRLLSN